MAQYYVDSVSGSNSNAGTSSSLPWQTVAHVNAQSFNAGDTIYFKGGDLFNDTALAIASNGTSGNPITVTSYGSGSAIIAGGSPVTGWTQTSSTSKIWQTTFNASSGRPRNLWWNGIRIKRASTPFGTVAIGLTGGGYNYTAMLSGTGISSTGYSSTGGFLNGYANPTDIEFVFRNQWQESRIPVASISSTTITMQTGGWANLTWNYGAQYYATWPSTSEAINSYPSNSWVTYPQFVENSYEIFTANLKPGTFYHNRTTNVLYIIPPLGYSDPRSATIIVPTVETVLSSSGNYITYTGLTFAYTTCLQPSATDAYAEIQANVITTGGSITNHIGTKLNAAVKIANATGVKLIRNQFSNIGGPALTIAGTSTGVEVAGNVFFDISGNGIQIGDTANYTLVSAPSSINVHSNMLVHCGREFHGAIGIVSFYAYATTINHNYVAYMPYSGISNGWSWNSSLGVNSNVNCTVNYNVVHDCALTMNDAGGIYSNSSQTGETINYNFIYNIGGHRDYQAHGLYCDNGSAGVTANGNVMFHIAGTLFFGNDNFNNNTINTIIADAGTISGNTDGGYNSSTNTYTSPTIVGYATAYSDGVALGAGVESAYSDIMGYLPAFSNTRVQQTILNLSPSAYWPLSDPYGATTALDISGNQHSATSIGNGSVFGISGQNLGDGGYGAFTVDSTGGFETVASSVAAFGTGDFTVGAFIRLNLPQESGGNYSDILCNSDYLISGTTLWNICITQEQLCWIYYNSGVVVLVSGAGVSSANTGVQTYLNDGATHLVSVKRSSGTISMNIDGVDITPTGGSTSAGSATIGNATRKTSILNESDESTNENSIGFYQGSVKHAFIFNGLSLSAAQLLAIYQSGTLETTVAGTFSPLAVTTPASTPVVIISSF